MLSRKRKREAAEKKVLTPRKASPLTFCETWILANLYRYPHIQFLAEQEREEKHILHLQLDAKNLSAVVTDDWLRYLVEKGSFPEKVARQFRAKGFCSYNMILLLLLEDHPKLKTQLDFNAGLYPSINGRSFTHTRLWSLWKVRIVCPYETFSEESIGDEKMFRERNQNCDLHNVIYFEAGNHAQCDGKELWTSFILDVASDQYWDKNYFSLSDPLVRLENVWLKANGEIFIWRLQHRKQTWKCMLWGKLLNSANKQECFEEFQCRNQDETDTEGRLLWTIYQRCQSELLVQP